jgi:hypothetical protein
MKILRYLVLIAVVVLAAFILVVSRPPPRPLGDFAGFSTLNIPIAEYDLFDIGVADGNGDGHLDIYTTNHSAAQSYLLGDGAGGFEDAFSRAALDQDSAFPGLEDGLDGPQIDAPGLYIFRQDRWLWFIAHDTGEQASVSGSISLPWPAVIRDAPGTVTVQADAGTLASEVRFVLNSGESFAMTGIDDIVELPHTVSLDNGLAPDRVFIGRSGASPDSLRFALHWRDRHGVAWADIDGDGATDVFIARGGVKGQLAEVPTTVSDELLVASGSAFTDATGRAGLVKGSCPARQAAWIDVDTDGDLDLYVSCGRGDIPEYPNQLFRQSDDGTFEEIAGQLGLDYPTASVFAWLDSDTDGDQDLLTAEDGTVYLYENHAGGFTKQTIGALKGSSNPFRLAVADFDNDGDLDAFGVHRDGSVVLLNTPDGLAMQPASDFGLPDRGRAAHWIDVDRDGLVDLHVVPHGVYQQGADHSFARTELLAQDGDLGQIVEARSLWADFDEDGNPEVLIAAKTGPTLRQRLERRFLGRTPDLASHWQTQVMSADTASDNHWLQIDLAGPAMNRQAIGARVYVDSGTREQMQPVGFAEGAHFSQGHYRLYFGLGSTDTASRIRVVWPDGVEQSLSDVTADRILTITYDRQ